MRRASVLTNEAARHPSRASLPQYPRQMMMREDMPPVPVDWKLTVSDIRGVASTYVATFAATLAFII